MNKDYINNIKNRFLKTSSSGFRRQHLSFSSSANPDCGLITYFNYLDVDGTDKTTSFVKEIIYKLRKNGNYSSNPDLKFSYDYDSMGNITDIKDINDSLIVHYEYDELNQLKRENNDYLNKTVRYQYDDAGNIQSKTVYTLTLGNSDLDLDVLTPESTVNYGYDDSNWKDKLTSYNGQNITYDSIGNPLNYLNGWNFEWKNGRSLYKMVNSGYNVNVLCKYDESGVRTQKTVKSIQDGNEVTKTTDLITDGIQILSQKNTTVVTDTATGNQIGDPVADTIIWQIDGEGTVLGFIHNNEVYYYLKNAQGDIVGIADKDSNIVANYTYDSWGKLVSIIDPSQDNLDVTDVTSGNNSSHIAHINPLRYRGYYYDSETELYYLNARYYDPETCKFINSDNNLEGGLNLFEYCYNNPINFGDWSGCIPTAVEAAYMAKYIYKTTDILSAGDWKYVETKTSGDGMVMGVYSKTVNNVTEYALVNKGTTNLSNWINNIDQFCSGTSVDGAASTAEAFKFRNNHQGKECTCIGHSKGGAEAALNAVQLNFNAIIFNPSVPDFAAYAAIDFTFKSNQYNATLVSYVVSGDPVAAVCGEMTIGTTKYLDPNNWLMLPTTRHKMETIIKLL